MSPTTIAGSPAVPGQAHVDEVAVAQVDLGRAAGALADHHVVLARAARRGRRTRSRRARPQRRGSCAASIVSTASPSRTTWLEWSLPGLSSTGLNRTSGASPQAAACIAWARPISPPRPSGADHDDRVVGHVLRLERRHLDAPAVQPAADAGGQHALAGVRGGAGDEQPAAHRRLPARPRRLRRGRGAHGRPRAAPGAPAQAPAPDRAADSAEARRPAQMHGRRSRPVAEERPRLGTSEVDVARHPAGRRARPPSPTRTARRSGSGGRCRRAARPGSASARATADERRDRDRQQRRSAATGPG